MTVEDRSELENYLRINYAGVFPEETIQRHIEDYVNFGFARQVIEWVTQAVSGVNRLLDIGSGFGSFVFLCRERGIDATGIEIGEFEVDYARRRLKKQRPDDDPLYVYRLGNALHLPFPDTYFDVVTLWNVLEHISDEKRLLKEVYRVLRPGGDVYIISPNYAAFRKEAHYLIPWIPLLPKRLGSWYIRQFGKNPHFFEKGVFCRTNWGILRALRKTGLQIKVGALTSLREKIHDPSRIINERKRFLVILVKKYRMEWILDLFMRARLIKTYAQLLNPFKGSIILHLEKAEEN